MSGPHEATASQSDTDRGLPGSDNVGDTEWYLRPLAIGIIAFLLLLVVKADTLSEPPAWDAAMSVHPAAITLAETGFDYPALLSMPGYAEGGPNTHSLSLYTAVVAVAYLLLPSPLALLALHLLTFVFGAVTAAGIARFAAHFMSKRQAAITATVALAMPVVLTQFGMVYTEAPVLAASTWAMIYAVERRWLPVSALSLLASAIKPSGAITAAALGLFFLGQKGRWKQAIAIVAPSAALIASVALASPGFSEPTFDQAFALIKFSWLYLLLVPDLLAIVILASFAAALLSDRASARSERDLGHLWFAFGLAFVSLYATLASVGFLALPRYVILIAPLATVTLLSATARSNSRRAFAAVATGVFALSLVNFDGTFYPRQGLNNFALMERSDAYDDLLSLQVANTEAVCELGDSETIWYPKPVMYRIAYPAMGYPTCPNPGRAFLTESDIALESLPDVLIISYEYPWLGGATLARLVREAEASSNWVVRIEQTLVSGPFTQEIYRLTRVDWG